MKSEAREVLVREARAGDAQRIAELSGQLGYPATPEEVTRRFADIPRDGRHVIYVAQIEGRVAGWTHVSIGTLLEADRQAEVNALVVDEAHRGRKIGERLMEYAEAWARGKKCVAVRLRSNVIRERAHRFYERLGYEVIKTQKAFHKKL